MKLYKNLVNAVAQTVQEIVLKKRHADKAIEFVFRKNPQWGSRDRRFVAEGIYDIVRNFRLYATLAESENNFWFITAVWLVVKETELPAWPEFKHIDATQILNHQEQLKNQLPVFESYPDWLWELGSTELGKEVWEKEAVAQNERAPVYLRVNTLKTSLSELKTALQTAGIESEEVGSGKSTLKLSKRENIFQNKLFKEGWFEVQDGGSQHISEFLNPHPGETVIDACAGAGGKSLHMAALMKNKGKIISLDIEDWKLEELKKRARRAGAFNIETQLIQEPHTLQKLIGKADKLLLDVPCSGSGVLRRNPDTKWKLTPQAFEETKQTQANILANYTKMLKPGGVAVYSTCSIFPSENQQQVEFFLSQNPEFSLLKQQHTLTSTTGFDGFYMAAIKKG